MYFALRVTVTQKYLTTTFSCTSFGNVSFETIKMFSVIFVLLPLYYFDWTLRLKRRYFENKIIWTRVTRSEKNMQIRLWRILVHWASNPFGQREDWHLKRPGSPGDEDGSDVDISLRGNHCATVYGSLNFPWSVSLTFNESTRPVVIK